MSFFQSVTYCKFYEYYFTFHDIFVPCALVLLSTYVSLKFSGTFTTAPRLHANTMCRDPSFIYKQYQEDTEKNKYTENGEPSIF